MGCGRVYIIRGGNYLGGYDIFWDEVAFFFPKEKAGKTLEFALSSGK